MNTIPIPPEKLLRKYDVPTPRYTSYPTVPCWDNESFTMHRWLDAVKGAFTKTNSGKGISLYVHLPFCESLCTYCACTTRITRNHQVEIPYIQALVKEWNSYKTVFGTKPVIREIHLGGGTPTFFNSKNLAWLIHCLLEDVDLHKNFEFSFEGHPANTTREHLKTLFDLGFRRVSFGVQDLDEKVQQTINRIQSFEVLANVVHDARSIGYTSVSFDLIYGLPFQNPFTISNTFDRILDLRPDRIAFYSYAHVPWLKPGQRGYEDADLPSGPLKRHLYEIGCHKLRQAGYEDIGMDHFALRHDALFKAHVAGTLHRNFMGYTVNNTDLLIGLGASAISDAGVAYGQNTKNVETYLSVIKATGSAIEKGHILTHEDTVIRQSILEIACRGRLHTELLSQIMTEEIFNTLRQMEQEGILYLTNDGLHVTTAGRPFIRNICGVLDKRLTIKNSSQTFSRSI